MCDCNMSLPESLGRAGHLQLQVSVQATFFNFNETLGDLVITARVDKEN